MHGRAFLALLLVICCVHDSLQLPAESTLLIDFGIGHYLNGQTATRDEVIANVGVTPRGPVTITSITLVGANPYSFTIVSGGSTPVTFVEGQTHIIKAAFVPQAAYLGAQTATMRIECYTLSGVDKIPYTFDVVLKGISGDFAIDVPTQAVDFGSQHITSGPAPSSTITISNKGTSQNLVISRLRLCPSTSCPSYTMPSGQQFNKILAPQATFNIVVTWDPSTPKFADTAQVVIESDDKTYPIITITYTGMGTDDSLQLETPTSKQIAFGTQDTDAPASNYVDVRLKNRGTVGHTYFTSYALETGTPSDFELSTGGNPGSIAPGNTHTFKIRFTPVGTGPRSTNFKIVTRDLVIPIITITISASAIHPKLNVSKTYLDFGEWDVYAGLRNFGWGELAYPVLLTNYGLTNLEISRVDIPVNPGGAYSSSIKPTTSNPFTLAAGATTIWYVYWDPTTPNGANPGLLTLNTNEYTNPVYNVTTFGQGIEQLNRLYGNWSANISFTPPYAEQPTRVTVQVRAADTGLPKNGAIKIGFPEGFVFADVYASMFNGTDEVIIPAGDNIVVDTVARTIRLSIVNLPINGIGNGKIIRIYFYHIEMPVASICNSAPPWWRWDITTYDAVGGLLEYWYKADVGNDFCVDRKLWNATTVPAIANLSLVEAGMAMNFGITVQAADMLKMLGIPVMNTTKGADQMKIVEAYSSTGGTQSCQDGDPSSRAVPNYVNDIGPGEGSATTASFTAIMQQGYYRLCFLSMAYAVGWEQIGDIIHVSAKQVPTGSGIPLPPYTYLTYPAAPKMVSSTWQDFTPRVAIISETVVYTFTGYHSYFGLPYYAKVSNSDEDCYGNADGTPADGVLISNTKATFTVTSPGLYKMCVKWETDWEPINNFLWVHPVSESNLVTETSNVLADFQSCFGYVNYYKGTHNRCGCWYGTGPVTINAPMTKLADTIIDGLSSDFTIHQGCCGNKHTRVTVRADAPTWGYCTP